jgi:hypothetical protein
VASVTSEALGFPSYLECAGEADGGAACAGLAGATSTEDLMPWAVAESKRGAGCTAIAEAPVLKRTVCSTWTEASGLVADRKLAFHAGRAVVIEQMQES